MKKIALTLTVIVLGVIIYLTALSQTLSNITSTYTYSGELISYEQQDLLHGGYLVDHTVLRFADGKTFTVDGSGVYAIGMNYTLTIEKAGPWTKVTSITTGESETKKLTLPEKFYIVFKCYGMKYMAIWIQQGSSREIICVSSNFTEVQTNQKYGANDAISLTFYRPDYAISNSLLMHTYSSYLLRYNETSRIVEAGR